MFAHILKLSKAPFSTPKSPLLFTPGSLPSNTPILTFSSPALPPLPPKALLSQCQALGASFTNLKLRPDDSIVVSLGQGNFMEKMLVKSAAQRMGMTVYQAKFNDRRQFQEMFDRTKARVFVFNSYEPVGKFSTIQLIYKTMPQIMGAPFDSQVSNQRFEHLKILIQADHYKYKGTYSFNKLIRFDNIQDMAANIKESEAIELPIVQNEEEINWPVVITQPLDQLAHRMGTLNFLLNRIPLICSQAKKIHKISDRFQNKIRVICTQELEGLHQDNLIFVKKGSPFCQTHPKRVQIQI